MFSFTGDGVWGNSRTNSFIKRIHLVFRFITNSDFSGWFPNLQELIAKQYSTNSNISTSNLSPIHLPPRGAFPPSTLVLPVCRHRCCCCYLGRDRKWVTEGGGRLMERRIATPRRAGVWAYLGGPPGRIAKCVTLGRQTRAEGGKLWFFSRGTMESLDSAWDWAGLSVECLWGWD